MQTLVALFNQALSAVGNAADVVDPEQKTKSANMCRLWYDVARRKVFGAYYWPGLRATQRLSLVSRRDSDEAWEDGDPDPMYGFAYALPVDCIRPRFLSTYERFTLGQISGQQVVFSNADRAILSYTKDFPNPGLWEPDLYEAVLYALAAALNTASNGKVAVTNNFDSKVRELIEISATRSANSEDETYVDSRPSFYAGAGYALNNPSTGFLYPVMPYRVGATL